MGKIFSVEFQMYYLKFHTKYLINTLKDVHFMHSWKFKSSYIKSPLVFLKRPTGPVLAGPDTFFLSRITSYTEDVPLPTGVSPSAGTMLTINFEANTSGFCG